jgi:hypothetical protein
MATFKTLVNRFRAFNRDEQGAAGSIEVVGAVAVGVLILAAVYKIMGNEKGDGVVSKVSTMITNLVTGNSAS